MQEVRASRQEIEVEGSSLPVRYYPASSLLYFYYKGSFLRTISHSSHQTQGQDRNKKKKAESQEPGLQTNRSFYSKNKI